MKFLIIRHGEPNYEIDSLTEKGKVEAALLGKKLDKIQLDDVYVSPLGRAKLTAEIALKNKNVVKNEREWLQEFCYLWDRMPSEYEKNKELCEGKSWLKETPFATPEVSARYEALRKGLDEILFKHGYKKNGALYEAFAPSYDTVALFCHYGVECVILSYLLNVSPYIFFQSFCALPTSVTTVVTEEREKGKAIFRLLSFGDLSHLYAGNEEPSFAARFAEIYGNGDRV